MCTLSLGAYKQSSCTVYLVECTAFKQQEASKGCMSP
jgi:hypothetical protein